MKQRIAIAASLLAAVSVSAHAEIFRCTAAGGSITYQEIPCPSATQARTMDIPSEFPEVNRVERDRLLARADALEARLLKRAELESAERIARDERIARERELQAMRESQAQREAAAAVPLIIFAPASRPPRHWHRRPPSRL